MGLPTDFAQLQFSSSELPERDRVSISREVFGRKVVHAEIEPNPDDPFYLHIAMRELPGLRTHVSTVSGLSFKRTHDLLSDGDDDFALLINMAGASAAAQLGRETSLGPGDAVLLSHTEPATLAHRTSKVAGILVPRTTLASFVDDPDAAAVQLIPQDTDALRLLILYLGAVQESGLGLHTPDLRRAVATHIQDLVALTIGATRDGAAIAAGRGLRAARLQAVKKDIFANLASPSLTEAAVARRLNLSPRYIRMLFEAEDTNFSSFVLAERLALAHRSLSDPRFRARKIIDIAFESGFGDLSYFNRTFKRRFNASPSEIRHASLCIDGPNAIDALGSPLPDEDASQEYWQGNGVPE